MEYLYNQFEKIFTFFESLELSLFTGGYLTFQVMFFILLILIHQIISRRELWAMKKVKKELVLLDQEKVDELQLNVKINTMESTRHGHY